jgi:hypothetical protein
MGAQATADSVSAETWFLKHGLPSVLTPRARWRRLWQRSAPVLAGFSTTAVAALIIAIATGFQRVDIDLEPTRAEWVVIAVLPSIVPVAFLVGWLVSRIGSDRGRQIAATASVAVMVIADVINSSFGDTLEDLWTTALLAAIVLLLTGLGIGSVIGWAVRLTVSHVASVGALALRALPVVLLTVLVFFNSYVWAMATLITRTRIWMVIGFLVLIAIAFLITGLLERVRPILSSATAHDTDGARLAGTPFEAMPDPVDPRAITRGEWFNVVFLAAASQIAQVLMVAVVTAGIFFTLGLMVLSQPILADWTKQAGTAQGTMLGMTLPVPQALIHVTMFIGAMTFMYVSARAVGDGEYRAQFLDPLIDDLRLTLVARNRYRAHVSAR